jgi:hypothetical protein
MPPMSWLIEPASQQPTYDVWRQSLHETRRLLDPGFLERLRARLQATYSGTASPPRPSGLEADMTEYVEQLAIDPTGIGDDLGDRLSSELSPEELANLAFAGYSHDADIRMRTLLGLDPSLPWDGPVHPEVEGEPFVFPLVDSTYGAALGRFGLDACRRTLVDDVTSEICRLRNALHQHCRF